MKNNFQPKTQMTNEEICQKYNNGRRIIDFVGHKKIFFGISLAIIAIGIICNIIFGVALDIQFSGGTTLKFSYSGQIDQNELYQFIQDKTTDRISTSFSTDIMGNSGNNVSVQFSGNDAMSTDIQQSLEADLQKEYPTTTLNVLSQTQSTLLWDLTSL